MCWNMYTTKSPSLNQFALITLTSSTEFRQKEEKEKEMHLMVSLTITMFLSPFTCHHLSEIIHSKFNRTFRNLTNFTNVVLT